MRLRQIVPSLLIFLPLMLLGLNGIDTVHVMAKDHSTNVYNHPNDPTISVNVVNPEHYVMKRPSCIHSFAQLQIHNHHKLESLIIQDVQVFPTHDESVDHVKSTLFGGRQVMISPDSSAYIPMSMFSAQMNTRHRQKKVEFYSSDENNGSINNDSSEENQSPVKDVSIGVAIHLGKMANVEPRNLGGLNVEKISNSTIVLKTNRGKFRSMLESSSIALNPYGLPHTLVFSDDGFVSDADSIVADYHHQVYSEAMNQEERDRIAYEYDLYIDNPFQDGMMLIQVYPSRPDLIEIIYEHSSGENQMNGKNSRFNNCGFSSEERAYCNLAQTFTLSGPLRVKSESKKTYVATIRLKKNGIIALQEENESFMGYLHLKFHNIFMSIALEYDSFLSSQKQSFPVFVPTESDIFSGNKSEAWDKKQAFTQNESLQMFNDNLVQKRCEDSISDFDPVMDRLGPPYVHSLQSRELLIMRNTTFATNDSIDFGGVAAAVGGERMIGISVSNRLDKRVVMKQKIVHTHRSSKNENTRMGESSQTDHEMQHSFQGGNDDFFAEVKCIDPNLWIEPGETIKNACTVTFKLLPSDLHLGFTEKIDGSVSFHFGESLTDDFKITSTKQIYSFNDNIIEIPWKVSVTEGYLEYNLRDSYFQMDLFQNGTDLNCGFLERRVAIKNHCKQTLRISEVYLKHENEDGSESMTDNFCRSRFSVTNLDTKRFLYPGDNWEAINIRFAFKPLIVNETEHLVNMKTCHLIIETDVGGEFQMPLVVEDGKVLIVPSSSVVSKKYHLDSLHSSYRNMITSPDLSTLASKDRFREFLKSISKHVDGNQNEHVDPILLDFGLASPNSVETESFFVVNHNSIPLDIIIDNPSYEGAQVRLGRIPYSFDTFLNSIMVEGKKILMTENSKTKNEPVLDYFRGFAFRDDIDVHPTSTESLKKIYRSSTKINVYKTKFDMISTSASPMAYTLNKTSFETRRPGSKIYFATSSNDETRDLVSDSSKLLRYSFTIPPGARARLEVSVMSPPNDFIDHNQAIADLATSGTIIKTDHGEIIPIVVKYSMFSGNITVTSPDMHVVDAVSSHTDIYIYPLFREQEHHPITYNSTKLSVRIGSNSTIEVVKIESCNEWFEIVPSEECNLQDDDSINFIVRSIIDCGDQQSFFNCALLWLNDYKMIQERHCAFRYEEFEAISSGQKERTQTETINTAIEILKKAKSITDQLSKSKDIIVLSEYNIAIQNAFKAWDRMKRFGLNRIHSGLRAHLLTQRGSNESNEPPTVKTLKDVILRTDLEMPTLLPSVKKLAYGKVLSFPVTDISDINEIWLPVQNPTGYYLKARLRLHDPTQFYIPSAPLPDGQSNWWFGTGGYFLPDERGSLCVSDHNVTIRTGGGSSITLFSPSLHATNAFSLGCTDRRCGCSFPNTPNNPSKQRRSTVGASAAQDSKLRGRIYSTHGILDSSYDAVDFKMKTQPFSMDLKALDDVIIAPYENVTIGPFFFRPPSNDYFSASLSIQNNFTGLETFSIYGEGASAKLTFFDKNELADDIEMRFGKPALVFKGEKILGQQHEVKSVYLANLGENQVKILDIWLSSTGGKKFIKSYGNLMMLDSKCRRRGFHLIGCDSTPPTFLLSPNQQKPIYISFAQDCSFNSMYVSLNVKYESLGTATKHYTETLLLVYDLSTDAINECRHSPIPASLVAVREKIKESEWRWLFAFSTFLIPFGISILITIDMVAFSRQNFDSSKKFRILMNLKSKKKGTSKKTGFKNWSSAYRCLSRADPSSQELVQLSKEQTRQMLLNTFKRDDMISPNCILANGTFCREKQGLGLVSTSGPAARTGNNQASHTKNNIPLSLCDAVFPRRRFITGCEDGLPLLPCGLGWRVYSNVTNVTTDTESKSKPASKESEKQMEPRETYTPISDHVTRAVPQDRIMGATTSHTVLDKAGDKVQHVPLLVSDGSEKNEIRTTTEKRITKPPQSERFKDSTAGQADHKCTSSEGFADPQVRPNIVEKRINKNEEFLVASRETTEICDKVEKKPLNLQNDPERQIKKTKNTSNSNKKNEDSKASSSHALKASNERVIKSNLVTGSLSREREKNASKRQEIKTSINTKSPVVPENVQANENDRINSNELNKEDNEIVHSSQNSVIMTTPKHEKQILSYPSESLTRNLEHWSPAYSPNMSSPTSPTATFHLPPPGLAPPPGFGTVASEMLPPSSPLKIQNLSNDVLKLVEAPKQDEHIQPNILKVPSVHSLENSSLPFEDKEEAEVNSFNETMDVMNFFNFLDESADAHFDENPNINNHGSEDANFAPLLLNSNQNPWGDSHLTTRAGVYGFSVNEDDNSGDNDSAAQMLASSLFMSNTVSEEIEGTSSKAFDADAFFSDIFDDE